jgi:uncharacterized phiE125 gp8 family phage protein
MNLTRTLDAESEALSLTDVKDHFRITGTDDDDNLRSFIAAIRHRTENYLRKSLITSTWELKLDAFDPEINLLMGPVQSITSVQYVDTDGATQTLASSGYQNDAQGRLCPSYGNSWPSTRSQYDAVTVTYVAGKTHAGNVAQDIKLAMLLWIGACDVNRENVIIGTIIATIPDNAKALLTPHRNWKL